MALTKIPANLLDKSAHVDFADNERLRIGTGNDLQIFHDSTNSIIHVVSSGDTYWSISKKYSYGKVKIINLFGL